MISSKKKSNNVRKMQGINYEDDVTLTRASSQCSYTMFLQKAWSDIS
jgi:hypothetical protein